MSGSTQISQQISFENPIAGRQTKGKTNGDVRYRLTLIPTQIPLSTLDPDQNKCIGQGLCTPEANSLPWVQRVLRYGTLQGFEGTDVLAYRPRQWESQSHIGYGRSWQHVLRATETRSLASVSDIAGIRPSGTPRHNRCAGSEFPDAVP